MEDVHEIKTDKVHMIFNGGNPLPGCPKDCDEARKWLEKANRKEYRDFQLELKEWNGPYWKWDCGFKLDFDGSFVYLSSRFYPPKEGYGPQWDGTATIMIMGKDIFEKEFKANTLHELHREVVSWKNKVVEKIKELLTKDILNSLSQMEE